MIQEIKFLPEGYRYVKVGEPICVNDYYWDSKDFQWRKIQHTGDMSNWVADHLIRKNSEDQKNEL